MYQCPFAAYDCPLQITVNIWNKLGPAANEMNVIS
jgi:hypothetical protein